MPYFLAADSRKSKTSRLFSIERDKSAAAPVWAWMRWSQWIEEGTAVEGKPQVMNCSKAICADAS